MGVVISFINLKGGVGKTTCCANIAGELSRENRKVLVIDADAQASISTLLMGSKRYEERFPIEQKNSEVYKKTIYQLFLDVIDEKEEKSSFDINNIIIRSVVQKEVQGKKTYPLASLDLVPATYHLMQLEQKIVNYVRSRYAILDKSIEQIKNQYDFIIIDCPPNIYTATQNSLYASDYYIIPTIPDYLSITGMTLLVNNLNKTIEIKKEEKKKSVELAGILVNLRVKRLTVHNLGISKLERLLENFKAEKIVNPNAIIFENKISNRVDIATASGNHLPICVDKPRSESTMEFKNLCQEIINRISK